MISAKPKVSIGIPAYNEEANIKNLLENLLKQREEGFVLKEIIVVSDGSTDGTAEEVREIKDARITFIDDKERKGLSSRQNELLDKSTGDIIILLDADILPSDHLFISKLVSPFWKHKNTGMVGAKVVPLPAESFFEKIINFSVAFKQEVFEKINNGDNAYLCHGRARAFSKELARQLRWPEIVSEDAYSYFICKQKGFDFQYEPTAIVFYRSPQSLGDHLKQSTRFIGGKKGLSEFVSNEAIRNGYCVSRDIFIKKALKFFLKNPLFFVLYCAIYATSLFYSEFSKKTSFVWKPSDTSKVLVHK